jgi:octaprenyl-diphosphate synthase
VNETQTDSAPDTAALPAGLAFPFGLVQDALSEVDEYISSQARAFDPGVEGYVAYVCEISGKRIRPALTLLAGGAAGEVNREQLKIGSVVELIHLATLIHDDIMDGADVRREMPTASAKWGASLSVLLGDCLFARALELASDFDDNAISKAVSAAAGAVCQGEILQTQRRFDLNLSREDYFRIIEMKTGALFAVACELGARLAGADDAAQANLRDFGMKLGTAYQIYDDCLDLVGQEEIAGKTLGTDLTKGKLTLPVLNLIGSATQAQREKLNKRLLQNEPIDVTALAGIADYDGAIERAVDTGKEVLAEARKHLVGLDDTDYREALAQVTRYLDGLLDGCLS